MRTHSLLFKLSAALSACMAALGAALVTYAGIVVRQQAIEKAELRMETTARDQAELIRKRFESAMDIARTLTHSLRGNLDQGSHLSRGQANAILRHVLEGNPDFLASYTLWEPEAFDGQDRQHRKDPQSDASGRFMPYWNRGLDGSIQVEPIAFYDTPGVGDYYLVPKRTLREIVTEPYHYPVRGQDVFMTSMIVPILDQKGGFQGITGVDLRIDFLQQLADAVDVYNHAGKLYLLTSQGTIAAITGFPSKIGSQGLKPEDRPVFEQLTASHQNRIFSKQGKLYALIPLEVGRGVKPWGVVLEVPRKVILLEATRTIRNMILVGTGILLLGLLGMFLLLKHGFVARILALNRATRAFAEGDHEARCPIHGHDEIQELGESFNDMAAHIRVTLDELQAQRLLLAAVLDNTFQMIGLLTPDGRLVTANRSALALVDCSLEAIQGMPFWELPWWEHDEAERAKLHQGVEAASRGVFSRFETSNLDHEGRIHRVDLSISPLRREDGTVQNIIVEGRNITELKEAEQRERALLDQLHHSQKMDAIGQLVGGVAHDFNNFLAGILGACEVLQNESSSPSVRQRCLDLMRSTCQRAGDLVAKLLAFSRSKNKQSTPINLEQIIKDTLVILERTLNRNIQVSFSKECSRASIIGDDSQIQSVLLNMAINASHAMPEGGRLDLYLREADLDPETCAMEGLEAGTYLELEVRDTGCGMPPEVQKRIFEPFFTTKEKGHGTGLGLAAAFDTIKSHHGCIHVYSQVGLGTTFRIYLPAADQEAAPETTSTELAPGQGLLLLIDDDDLIRITAQRTLESLGYQVLQATNGEEGLALFKRHADEIDLVILDMIMPVMGGRETFHRLRTLRPAVPVILASGFSEEKDLESLQASGLNGHIRKPFRFHVLCRMISDLLEEKRKQEQV